MIEDGDIVICVGGGFFGTKAAISLKKRGARVIIIDSDRGCEAIRRNISDRILHEFSPEDVFLSLDGGKAVMIIGDGIDIFLRLLDVETPEFVIPAINGHFVGMLVKRWIEKSSDGKRTVGAAEKLREVLSGIPGRLVLLSDEKDGVIITSYMPMGGRCEDGCKQGKICPVTGISRPAPMYEILRFSVDDFFDFKMIFRSIQMDGVGGIKGKEIRKMLNKLGRLLGEKTAFTAAVGTSCSCHGILNLLEISSR